MLIARFQILMSSISCAVFKIRIFAVNIEEYPICLYLPFVDRI